jgi:hypothetical protein
MEQFREDDSINQHKRKRALMLYADTILLNGDLRGARLYTFYHYFIGKTVTLSGSRLPSRVV